MNRGLSFHACAASTAIWLATAAPAAADIVIVGSNSASVRVGRVLGDGEALELSKGVKVRIMTPAGVTSVLTGPLSVKAGELAKGGAADTALWNDVTRRLNAPPDDDEPFTRGLAPASTPPDTLAFSWHDVPVGAEGEICIEKGAPVALVRADGREALSVTLLDTRAGGGRAKVTMAPGEARAPWPREVEVHTGSYAMQSPGGEPHRFRLRLISPLPGTEDAVRVLHGQRCERQRDALLDALRDPGYVVSAAGP